MKDLISGSVPGSALWDFHSAFTPWAISREVPFPESRSTTSCAGAGLCCPFEAIKGPASAGWDLAALIARGTCKV